MASAPQNLTRAAPLITLATPADAAHAPSIRKTEQRSSSHNWDYIIMRRDDYGEKWQRRSYRKAGG
jgi:hypothetical protein